MRLVAAACLAFVLAAAALAHAEPRLQPGAPAEARDCELLQAFWDARGGARLSYGWPAWGEGVGRRSYELNSFRELNAAQIDELYAAARTANAVGLSIDCNWNRGAYASGARYSFSRPAYTSDGAWAVFDFLVQYQGGFEASVCVMQRARGDWRLLRCGSYAVS